MLTAAPEVADNGALSSESEARHAPEPEERSGGDGADGDKAEARSVSGREMSFTMLLRELFFCAALALTTYGALHTSPPKISKHPPAVRFFPPDSSVADWYRGQLTPALAAIGREDVSLVMYYAPWDAECQHVRGQFDIAASLLHHQVYFAAINCWNPGSECRLQHKKIPSWPVIMAYTVNSKGILYRGPRDAHSLVKFAELMSRPLRRVANVGDLVSLVAVCDAVAVAFTPLSASFKHYNVWYGAALKSREHDPLGEICFAVVTSEELAADLGVHAFPALRYMLWNETLEYASDSADWTEAALASWVLQRLSQPAARVTPAWQKAFSLQRYADGSPLLMLFTPLEPLYEQQPMYDLLREVSMEYYDCTNSEWTQEIIRLQQLQRLIYQQNNVVTFCKDYKLTPRADTDKYKQVLSQYKSPWHNATYKRTNKDGLFSMLVKSELVRSVAGGKEDMLMITPAEECGSEPPDGEGTLEGDEQCDAPEKEVYDKFETSMLPTHEDRLSAERLVERQLGHTCELVRFAATRAPLAFPRPSANYTRVHGLACKTNATLNFVAIDSIRNHHFAESLGINIDSREDKTAVVILDSKLESQFELRGAYTEGSLRRLIRDYGEGRLKRVLRSAVRGALHTHYYGSGGEGGARSLRLLDLTSRTFRRFVDTSGEVGIVLVCGGACASHVVRSALSAARLLAARALRVSVARVDALRHDLPWQYTAHTYPTVLVFPADRRLESGAYPAGERVSAAGVVALATRTLGPPTQLRVQLAMCNAAAGLDVKRKCLRDMREQVVALIGRTLKHHRRAGERVRSSLFARLESLQRVHLDLHALHATQVNDGDASQSQLLDSLSQLANTWDLRIPVVERETRHSS